MNMDRRGRMARVQGMHPRPQPTPLHSLPVGEEHCNVPFQMTTRRMTN
jgi:hypothetical protein